MIAVFWLGVAGALVTETWSRSQWIDDLVVEALHRMSNRIEQLEGSTAELAGRVRVLEQRVEAARRELSLLSYSRAAPPPEGTATPSRSTPPPAR